MAETTAAPRMGPTIRLMVMATALVVAPLTVVAQPAVSGSGIDSARIGPDSSVSAATRPRRGFAIFGEARSHVRDSLVALAREQLGRRYVFGGTTPERGFDCSGLVRYLLAKVDIVVPRTAAQQEAVGLKVAKDTAELQPGDLVTFGRGGKATHIGIYVGDGRFIHASSAAGKVVESRLIRRPTRLIKPWRSAIRLFAERDSAAVAGDSDG